MRTSNADPERVDQDCRREAPTGSRLGKVVCMSAAERARIEQESRDSMERMQRQGSRAATKDGG